MSLLLSVVVAIAYGSRRFDQLPTGAHQGELIGCGESKLGECVKPDERIFNGSCTRLRGGFDFTVYLFPNES